MSKITTSTKKEELDEVYADTTIKVKDAIVCWEAFLGNGPYNNLHPVTGIADPDRIFSTDGTRSIRFTKHEMKSLGKTKAHYHEEKWLYDPITDTLTIHNKVQRIEFQKFRK